MRWSRYIAKPYPPRKRGWRSAARDDKDEAAPLREAPKTRKKAHNSKVDTLAHETQKLAEFAVKLRYEDAPADANHPGRRDRCA